MEDYKHCISRIEHWMRELDRMLPNREDRDKWLAQHCGNALFLWEGRDCLHMTEEGFHELERFKMNRPHLRRGANKVTWKLPEMIKEAPPPERLARYCTMFLR